MKTDTTPSQPPPPAGPRCPFCGAKTKVSDMPADMKDGDSERWLVCSGGCWIDGVSIPESYWPFPNQTPNDKDPRP